MECVTHVASKFCLCNLGDGNARVWSTVELNFKGY